MNNCNDMNYMVYKHVNYKLIDTLHLYRKIKKNVLYIFYLFRN